MCVWRDSCPAHLPPLRPATFIINPDDQVAMSLCPCQGMLRSDLWTSIRHSSAHVYRSCTAWLTRHLSPAFGTVRCGYIMNNHTRYSQGITMLQLKCWVDSRALSETLSLHTFPTWNLHCNFPKLTVWQTRKHFTQQLAAKFELFSSSLLSFFRELLQICTNECNMNESL